MLPASTNCSLSETSLSPMLAAKGWAVVENCSVFGPVNEIVADKGNMNIVMEDVRAQECSQLLEWEYARRVLVDMSSPIPQMLTLNKPKGSMLSLPLQMLKVNGLPFSPPCQKMLVNICLVCLIQLRLMEQWYQRM